MLWLQRGDRLPSVALVQYALGFPPEETDGVFGGDTKDAVIKFQREKTLGKDGIVGPKTWGKLSKQCGYPIVNVVDQNDSVGKAINNHLIGHGGNPITPAFRSNAMALIGRMVPARSKKEGPLGLLRVYGHGNSGKQNLSTAKGGHWMSDRNDVCIDGKVLDLRRRGKQAWGCAYNIAHGEGLTWDNFELAEKYFAPLKKCFGPLGSVELHGCRLASGKKGQKLLFRLSGFLNVPVTAAIGSNKTGTDKRNFRVEKPRSTWFPLAGELVDWAKAGAKKAAALRKPALAR